MNPWKKFRIAFTIFTGLTIIGVYTVKGTFSRSPITTLQTDLQSFYTASFNSCMVTEVNEIHSAQYDSHHTYFRVNCSELYFPFIPASLTDDVPVTISPGDTISKRGEDDHFILTNTSGDVHLTMTKPADVRLPFDWEFPLIMGSFVIINLCIFFIFPKRYFNSEDTPE